MVYLEIGDYYKAKILFNQATEICRSKLGEKHPIYAKSLNNLANTLRKLGEYSDAESLLLQHWIFINLQ